MRSHREPGAHAEAAAVGARAGGERAAEHRDALAHPRQPSAAAVRRRPAPAPSSATSSSRSSARTARGRRRWQRPACFIAFVSASCTIRYALTSTAGGSGRASPSTVESTSSPARRAPSTSSPSRSRPGCGSRGAPPSPSRPEQPAHLAQPLAGRALDRGERRARALRVAGEHVLRAAGLHDDRGERVRDGVVHLAGDPRALGRGCLRRALVRVALHRERGVVAAPRDPADGPDAAGEEQRGQQVGRGVAARPGLGGDGDGEREQAEREQCVAQRPVGRDGVDGDDRGDRRAGRSPAAAPRGRGPPRRPGRARRRRTAPGGGRRAAAWPARPRRR